MRNWTGFPLPATSGGASVLSKDLYEVRPHAKQVVIKRLSPSKPRLGSYFQEKVARDFCSASLAPVLLFLELQSVPRRPVAEFFSTAVL